jgi:undecaprenyl-diphosphatase
VFRQVDSLDQAFTRWVNVDHAHGWLDYGTAFMADFGLTLWPLLLGLLLLLIFGKFRERLFLVLFALCIALGDPVIANTIKKTVNRPRPCQALHDIRHVKRDGWGVRTEWTDPAPPDGGRSLPSSHVCNNVALALLLTLLYPPWGALAWIWALLMGFSRIYTGDHYLSDVLASALLASAYTLLICCAAGWVWRRYGSRFMPDTFRQHPNLYPGWPSRS